MKKKLLSLFCVLALCLGMLPVTVLAADVPDDLWVNGVQVTAQNAVDVLGDGTVSYANYALTLNGANITKGDSAQGAGIYSGSNLNITLAPGSQNTVSGASRGIYADGLLTIQGGGALTVSGSGDEHPAIAATQDATLSGVTVTASTKGQRADAIYAGTNLTVSSSTVTTHTDGNGSTGLAAEEAVTIGSSTITTTGASDQSTGISAYGSMNLSDSTLDVSTSGSFVGYGISSFDQMTITSCTITAMINGDMGYGIQSIRGITVSNSTVDVTINGYGTYGMDCNNLTVNSSVASVTAGGEMSVGIGVNSYDETNGNTTITNSWVYTNSSDLSKQSTQTNSAGIFGTFGSVKGLLTLTGNAAVPAGVTLSVPAGASLTVPKDVTLTNNGTINVAEGGTVNIQGKLVDNGTINGTVLQPNVEQPSSWAAEQVNAAIAAGIVPASLQSKYTQTATRAEFCALAVAMYETVTGTEITDRLTFADTSDPNVEKMAALGVVNGTGGNNFSPDDPLNREQAATILARLSGALGKPISASAPTFNDNASISSWAFDSVGQVQAAKIMEGTGGNNFSPAVGYTREQCIITMMRLYDQVK